MFIYVLEVFGADIAKFYGHGIGFSGARQKILKFPIIYNIMQIPGKANYFFVWNENSTRARLQSLPDMPFNRA